MIFEMCSDVLQTHLPEYREVLTQSINLFMEQTGVAEHL